MAEFQGLYHDGLVARRRLVTVRPGARLDLYEDGQPLASFAYGTLRRVPAPPGRVRLKPAAGPADALLDLPDDADARALVLRCPELGAGAAARRRQGLRVVAWSMAAAASLAGLAIWGAPFVADRVAPLVPATWEVKLGEVVDPQVRRMFPARACDAPEGIAALRTLSARLEEAAGLPVPVRLAVIDEDSVNAFALPGGRVYVLRGLLGRVEGPDALAGVLAHELGHVAHRDGLRALVRSSFSGFLLGLLLGDVAGSSVVLGLAGSVIDARYSRDAERAADAYGAGLLRGLGRPVRLLGLFLKRLDGRGGGPEFLRSHPTGAERLALLEAVPDPSPPGPPLLDEAGWAALRAICARPGAARAP